MEVTSVGRDESGSLAVRLASQAAFRQANLEFNPALSQLRFSLDKRNDNSYVVRVTSLQPINEPYLDVLLELTWSTGRVLREYTVLLDPPALRATPDLVAPVTPAPQAPATAAAPTPPAAAAPAPSPAPAPSRAPAPQAAAPAPSGDGTYTVKPGDTLGKIAAKNKTAGVSLDQMLVAMFQANPNAFVGQNMNRLLAGKTLTIPSADDAQAIAQPDARQEVAAQSADFAQYRSRLAQAVAASPSAASSAAPSAAGQGKVTAKVDDKSSPTKPGDQLKIAKADAATAAKAAQDEAIAKQRALKEEEERAAELKKANEQLKKALELQSKAGATVQKQVEAKKEEPTKAAPVPAPVAQAPAKAEPPKAEPAKAEPAKVEPAKAEPAKAEAPKVEPAKVEPAKVEPAKAEAPPAPKAETKPEPAKAAPTSTEAPGTGLMDMLKDSTSLGLIGALVLLLGGLVGLNIYRKRKIEKGESGSGGSEGMRANSLFGQTGGQSVDTGATSTFNSSFIPAASQLDSNEVDPVAEADVYIAYGREEQAEEILKEALRLQPDRHPVRVKLLEIYSRRGDKASFNAVADELRERTGGAGEDWDRAVKLGRSLDPANALFAGGAAAAEAAMRGPTTELRLNPSTVSPRPMDFPSEPPVFAPTEPHAGATSSMTTKGPDSGFSAIDTKMTADTSMPFEVPPTPPVSTPAAKPTSFAATLPLDDGPVANKGAGTIDPFGATAADKIDFAALDFDLGTTTGLHGTKGGASTTMPFDTKLDSGTSTQPAAPAPAARPVGRAPDADFTIPVSPREDMKTIPATGTGRAAIPDVDLTLPNTPAMPSAMPSSSSFDDALSRPTLLGEVGALPDEQAPRLTSNTDQATVPLIDFDLTGSDVDLGGRRTETQAGSPLAAQMATKLDLARGYIDLGVKDGARELLEEVMRDGTREQRQNAVELLKQVEV